MALQETLLPDRKQIPRERVEPSTDLRTLASLLPESCRLLQAAVVDRAYSEVKPLSVCSSFPP
jgi:hypothetical protein